MSCVTTNCNNNWEDITTNWEDITTNWEYLTSLQFGSKQSEILDIITNLGYTQLPYNLELEESAFQHKSFTFFIETSTVNEIGGAIVETNAKIRIGYVAMDNVQYTKMYEQFLLVVMSLSSVGIPITSNPTFERFDTENNFFIGEIPIFIEQFFC